MHDDVIKAAITRMLPAILRIPNPENSQPWEIAVHGARLEVFHASERDRLGSSPDDLCVFGAGMLAEAIVLAAGAEGLDARLTFQLHGRNDAQPWLCAQLAETGRRADPLAAGLTMRHSDRRRYAGGALNDPVFAEAKRESLLMNGAKLYCTDQYPQDFLEQMQLADRLIFQCQDIRRDFTRWARYTDMAISKTRDGMSWRAFLRQPERGFHYLQSRLWWLASSLDWFPVWLFELEEWLFDDSGRPSPADYHDGAAVCCITTVTDSEDDLVSAGRLALRLWLLFNLRGYSFQALTNLSCITYPHRLGRWDEPVSRIPELADSHGVMQRMFGFADSELPIFCFRAGLPIAPYPQNARSLRRDDRVRWVMPDCRNSA